MKHFLKATSVVAIGAVVALALAGCGATGGDEEIADKAPESLSGTITFWHHYSDREADVLQGIVDRFEEEHPDVTVDVSKAQEDTKIAQVATTSDKVDVMLVNLNDAVGTLCKSMADLQPYMDRDGVGADDFQPAFFEATEFDDRRCSLPTLSDVYGLYYNTDLLHDAGVDAPPKTLQELEDIALELTTYNDDGSIKTLGFNPLVGNGQVTATTLGQAAGGRWLDDDGNASLSQDSQWADLITWQKEFVDKIGYDKLKAFAASAGDEFSAENPFQNGRVAMALDGEWRVAFIEDQAADLNYGTAPLPVLDGSGQTYGGGYASGAAMGVNLKSKNKELSWALVKYISSNPEAAVDYANGFKNIPTLKAAAESADLDVPEAYETFVTAAGDPATATSPVTELGGTLTQGATTFWADYQAATASDDALRRGLEQVDEDIDNALELRGAK